jgi:hypothetical protein
MRRTVKVCLLALLAVALAVPAAAQTSTATIHGKVTNEQGTALGGAKIQAVGTASGFVSTVAAGADGSFQLGGLTPGTYTITVSASGFEARSETLTVLVAQNVSVIFEMTPTAVLNEAITVAGEQVVVDMKTPEAATNVTTQQIENLPQDDRNFLNFAALAPGIRLSQDPLRKVFAGDAQPSEQTNVYIDGVSQKNDVLMGGLVGQDSSRGNPFPQNAVQEFRVITQNFSAQYEKASSAIITAVTKSGGNGLKGQVFDFYQPKRWVAPLPQNFSFSTLTTNTSYYRNQPGISIGGPIIQDKLHFFLAYEGVDEHATTPVNVGNSAFASQFSPFIGVFASPFKSNLGFGKLSWQPADNQTVDWSGTYRREHEVRDFGTSNNPPASFQSATDIKNWVYSSAVRHQWTGTNTLNQAILSWQDYAWNPTPIDPNLVGLNYEGIIRIGGNTTTQKFDQRRIELRDDYSFIGPKWRGDQSIQVGVNLDLLRYNIDKSQNGNPQFNLRNDPANDLSYAQPAEAVFGFGNPVRTTSNQEYGVYGQDNWAVTSNLTVNVGLRWDYEAHGLDTGYVTPANIVAGLAGHVDPSYFSTGSQRHQFTDGFQPRVGFSYDLRGDAKSVVFGGIGRYFDRIFENATLDERFRLQFPVYTIEFSPDGRIRNGAPTIAWNPSYLSVAGLDALIASGRTSPQIFLLNNNTKPPYSNQWNIGFRQALGSWIGSLSYNGVRGYRGFTWISASPPPCCPAILPGFGSVILSDRQGKRYWYDGIYLALDRPYRSNWGAHLAWTHGIATQTGNDLFSLDYPTANQYPRHEVTGTERDRIVANAIVGLPWDFRFATQISLGTGGAFDVLDFTQGFSLPDRLLTRPFSQSIRAPKTWGFADRSVDFRLEKDVHVVSSVSVGVVGEIFNAFNWASYGCLNNFIGPGGNPSFGQPGCVLNLGRREQVGLKVNF